MQRLNDTAGLPYVRIVEALDLAEVRLVPLARAVHRAQPGTAGALRLAMLEAATAGRPRLVVDPRELQRDGPSYTVDTLRSLHAEFPEAPLCLLLGADALPRIFPMLMTAAGTVAAAAVLRGGVGYLTSIVDVPFNGAVVGLGVALTLLRQPIAAVGLLVLDRLPDVAGEIGIVVGGIELVGA